MYSNSYIIFIMIVAAFCCQKTVVLGYARRVRTGTARWSKTSLRSSTGQASGDTVKVLVAVSKGSEEIETVTIVDTLVRAGADVTLAAVCPNEVEVVCSRGVKLVADCKMSECVSKDWDMIACPGGMPGAEYLRDCVHLKELLLTQHAAGKYVAAVCAAPAVVLASHGLLNSRKATCYPAPKFIEALGDSHQMDSVVVDGNIITSQGPGTSLTFSLRLVEVLFGKEKSEALSTEMLH
mmetsp:Transcript_25163/g.41932  ORF Transcript_25163/g.41932 Transcript_25163/m.41932 type:complete len:237 (-) Transcript_25163:86-796(-)